LTYIGVAIIVILLVGLVIAISSGIKNKKNLNAEKLTSEKLLSEKLQVQKELDGVKADFASLQQQNDANKKLLEETNKKIDDSQRKINSLSRQNKSLLQTKKDLEDLQVVKAQIEKESNQLKSDYEKLLAKDTDLQTSLDKMEEENSHLTEQIDSARLYRADNYLVTATRGKKKEKVVICSSRTKKLNVAFEVPNTLSESLSFSITTPSGSTINPENNSISWYFIPDAQNYTASLSGGIAGMDGGKKVVLTYTAQEKLVKGEYQIHILCKGNDIGNCRIQLK